MQGLAGGRYQAVQDHLYAAGVSESQPLSAMPRTSAADVAPRPITPACGSGWSTTSERRATAFGDRSPESFRLTARRGMARQQSDRIHDPLSYGIR